MASSATRQKFCQILICTPLLGDSPSAIGGDRDKPLGEAQQNLTQDPASAYRWADLANSEMDANRIDLGKFCIRQALAAAPGSPAILFRAASFYLRIEDYPETLRNLMSVIRNPDLEQYYDRVFTLYSSMDLPLEELLDQGVPRTPTAANAFLRFWVSQNRADEAAQTWNWINLHSLTSVESAGTYVAMLAKAGRWTDAMAVWSSYATGLEQGYGRTNWIYDGSFEKKPVESPFDWRMVSSDAGLVERDTETGYKGSSSLMVRFLKNPADSAPEAYQMVVLKPGRWQLSAQMRTQDLTGNQGVVIRAVDAEDPARLDVNTNTFTRTQEWTNVSTQFAVSENTRLIRVEILRPPAQDMDIRVRGIVWIDAVRLSPLH